jgi:hypothetical protein
VFKSIFTHHKWALIISAIAVAVGFFYGGPQVAGLVAILGVMEVSLSFDNAVINAKILKHMSDKWQKVFLTWGLLIAVVGMRFILPMLLVVLTTGLNPAKVLELALAKGSAEEHGSFGYYLTEAHPQIAAFGGMFLLLLFLDYIFEEREIQWLTWLEKPLSKIGRLNALSYAVAGIALIIGAKISEHPAQVLIAGIIGIVTYILVNGLGDLFGPDEDAEEATGPNEVTKLVGKAAFFSFLYLEVIDSSFSFDGVIGAFAITSDPLIIALGLGIIGALFVRSITVHLVKAGTLDSYVYLEHGAHWAIGALAALLILSLKVEIPEAVTGLTGVVLIVAAVISSVIRNKRDANADVTAG